MKGATITWALAILLGAAVQAQAAATPEQKCQAVKNQAAGKYAACRQGAEKKLALTGDTVKYDAFILKCETKFATTWQKAIDTATKKGVTCLDAPLVEADFKTVIDAHTERVATGLEGGGLQDCAADLASCNASLSLCTGDLSTCDADLTSAEDQLLTCNEDLPICSGGLATCQGDLTTCQSDLADAEVCGNGAVDAGEDCDQANLDGETCASQSFAGGTLTCGTGCSFDTSGCYAIRFVDNADGTITDKKTGLIWEKKTELDSTVNAANPHDADNVYAWAGQCSGMTTKRCQPTAEAAALCLAHSEQSTIGCAACVGGEGTCGVSSTVWTLAAGLNGAGFAGATSWRVPKRAELESIVDYSDTEITPLTSVHFDGASCGAACTDITSPACSCTRSVVYWSASSVASDTASARQVSFGNGAGATQGKPAANAVRVVRGSL